MTAEWITPKTDWEDGDYYQHEDAERFINNLNYLRALGSPMVLPEASVLVPRENIGRWLYYSIFNIAFDFSRTIVITRTGSGSSTSIASVSYDSMFNSIEFDNVHDIFKIGLEILFKLRLLSWYCVEDYYTSARGYNKYPMYCNDSLRLDYEEAWVNIYPSSTTKILYQGWFLFPRDDRLPDPDEDLLDPLWKSVMHYSIPRPFSIYSSYEYINIQSRELLANQPFFTADVLNRIETYMLEVYNKFNVLRQTFPREDS